VNAPPVVSVTRLRLRSRRDLFEFLRHSIPAEREAMRSPGFLSGAVRGERLRVFWTLTMWSDRRSMIAYVRSEAHRAAARWLAPHCDEGSTGSFECEGAELPTWAAARDRLIAEGRLLTVRHPSPAQAAGRTPELESFFVLQRSLTIHRRGAARCPIGASAP
jgi:hypothetical protein